jgi:hypothetical protein
MIDRSCLHSGDLMFAQGFAPRPVDSGAYLKICSPPLLPSSRMVATIDLSGLTSSICALASAAAKLPIELLDCCMAGLSFEQLECDGARFGSPRTHAMPDRLLRILRHQALQPGLGFFVLEISRPGPGKGRSELSPRIGRAHIDNAHRLHAGLRRLDAEQARGLAILHAAPEFPFGGDEEVLVERIRMGGDLDPFAAAGDYRQDRASGGNDPHVVLQLGCMFFRRGFLRERPGEHEFRFEHRAAAFYSAVEGGSHPPNRWVSDLPLDIRDDLAGIGLVPAPVQLLSSHAELDDEVVRQIFGLDFAALLTGCRRMEAMSARWADIDVSGIWTKPGSSTKQKSDHVALLSGPARQLLSEIRAEQIADDRHLGTWVFPSSDSSTGHVVELARAWRTLCKAAGISGLRIHDLRHSFASQLASGGASLPLIGALLGHSNPTTTARYAHLFQDPQRAAVERVGAIVGAAGKDANETVETVETFPKGARHGRR